jgi:hypothetical protein
MTTLNSAICEAHDEGSKKKYARNYSLLRPAKVTSMEYETAKQRKRGKKSSFFEI